MLMKLIDEILGIIGIMIFVPLLILGIAVAFHFYPIITCVVGGLFLLGIIADYFDLDKLPPLSDAKAEKIGTALAILVMAMIIGIAFYYFPKTTSVVLSMSALGLLIDHIEKRKNTRKSQPNKLVQ